LTKDAFIDNPVNLNMVGLGDVRPRVENGRGPAGVVGEKQQAFACLVETPNRGEPGEISSGEAAINGFPALLICCASNDTIPRGLLSMI